MIFSSSAEFSPELLNTLKMLELCDDYGTCVAQGAPLTGVRRPPVLPPTAELAIWLKALLSLHSSQMRLPIHSEIIGDRQVMQGLSLCCDGSKSAADREPRNCKFILVAFVETALYDLPVS